MERICVLGGAGFLGSNFIDFLINENYRIICVDNLSYSGFLFNLKPYIDKSRIIALKEGKDFFEVQFNIYNSDSGFYRNVFLNKIFYEKFNEKIKGYNLNVFEREDDFKKEIENFLKNEEKFIFILGSITDEKILDIIFEYSDYVLNFAAETHVDKSIISQEEFIFTDIIGTYKILKTLKKYKNVKKFIQISTDEVYGSSIEGSFKENDILNPTSPYSASKASADLLCLSFYKTFNLPVIIVRPSNNYGPKQYPEKFIPLSIIKILRNEKVPIYGNGRQKREWIHVNDTAYGIYTVLKKGEIGEIYNIGSGFEIENIELVKVIGKFMGKDKDFYEFVKDRPSHDARYFLDSSKIRKLGWEPKINFYDGIKRTIEFYKENKEFYFKILESEEFKSFYNLWYQKR
ncbi:MAG: dTDP-glucose 4,6-dehydratase [candidate division WOR-3 bacterium]